MMVLTGRTIVSAVRPPYPYGGEFVSQFLFALRLCWFPLVVSTIAFGYAAPGLQGANFLVLFGALDRLGGFFVLASIREFAPFVTAIVLAGVAGTAITADLGARKIREELDALQVLGVDPVKNLVVPRFLALMLVTGLFDIYALLFGIFGGVVTTIVYDQPLGPFFATFFDNASVVDLWGSVLKCTLFGAIIAVVCCYKGMTASGGAAGRRARGQPGGGDRRPRRVRVQLRVHADAPGHPPGDREPPLSRGRAGGTSHGPLLARRAARLDRLLRRHRPLLRARAGRGPRPARVPLRRRGAAPGRAS